ncbi:pentatricopeptide repeat-containing protein At2g33680-like [Magnolia sinica]|uniref:pentatricopeptide repeat-containing protein At2g33680-like n=1 Tax=Magnolia sinica TaxID=86752 RepID=UPI00265859DD|nr:pentatricopeptide repeat-containing protein At2g33680-like [Magnolia sinica]XP_058095320.1 pentatricopeptide repeat-containing protein At2g33680-like [Magnolia sinica]
MISVNQSAISSFHRKILSLIPNCGNLLIHSNNFISQSPQKAHITTISRENGVDFHLQHRALLLQHSGDFRDLDRGKSLHSIFIKDGYDRDVFIQNNMLRMYANCGDLVGARLLFDEMSEPNLVSWTSMLSSYVQHGYADLGMQLFSLMCRTGLRPNDFGLSSALKACRIKGELVAGKLLHGLIIKCGFKYNAFCSSSVLDLYVKCGDMNDACRFFEEIPSKCEALWNTLIDGCVRNLDSDGAIELFHQMLLSEMFPSCFTYSILIKLCADILNLEMGRFFHCRVIRAGLENDGFVGAALVDIYAKWGAMNDACRVFSSLELKNDVVWSILLAGFHQSGNAEKGLDFFMQFISEGYKLDMFTLTSVFNLCSDLEIPALGLQVHCCFVKSGFVLDSFVGSAIIEMYVSFGMTTDAYKGFLDVRDKNEICFTAMISGFISDSDDVSAVELFSKMRKLGLMPKHSTLNYVLRAYADLDMLEEAKAIHSHIMKAFGESNLCLGNALIEMYAKCKGVDEAVMVFKEMDMHNEFSWTAMISGYIEAKRYMEGLELFRDMHSSTLTKLSQFTAVAVLQACSGLATLDQGRQTHAYIIKSGFQSNAFIGSALIDMYAKCGSVNDAFRAFSNMGEQDLVTWSTMMASYAQHGHGEEALKLLSEFQDRSSVPVNDSILSSCLSACSSLVALDMGKQIHARTIKTGFESHLHVSCGIIDMYCKCGSIEDARKFFDKMGGHNVVSWTAMVSGYAHHGFGKDALELFDKMKEVGVEPDSITFVGVLSACSHVGFVKEGWHHFESMKNDYDLDATLNHYACMVDLLGRAGHMDEAEAFINKAPFQSKAFLWRTLLGACGKHMNVEVGNRIAEILVKLEPDQPSTYVLLSNIYRSASMWEDSTEVRRKMRKGNMNKDPGRSWIQVAT